MKLRLLLLLFYFLRYFKLSACVQITDTAGGELNPVIHIKVPILKVPLCLISTPKNSITLRVSPRPQAAFSLLIHLIHKHISTYFLTNPSKNCPKSLQILIFSITALVVLFFSHRTFGVWPLNKIKYCGGTEGMGEGKVLLCIFSPNYTIYKKKNGCQTCWRRLEVIFRNTSFFFFYPTESLNRSKDGVSEGLFCLARLNCFLCWMLGRNLERCNHDV